LSRFPVQVSADAAGEWDVLISTSSGASSWEGLKTDLRSGSLHVVAAGDGDGNARVDMFDFFEVQTCFTGPVGPIEPPAYPLEPARRCGVYDFDDDGDVDGADYAAFRSVISGPGA